MSGNDDAPTQPHMRRPMARAPDEMPRGQAAFFLTIQGLHLPLGPLNH